MSNKPLHEIAEEKYLAAHKSQVEKGLAEYGVPLAPFNGRDAADDCRREMADANNYLAQLEMERDHWKAQAEFNERMIEAEIRNTLAVADTNADLRSKIATLSGEVDYWKGKYVIASGDNEALYE